MILGSGIEDILKFTDEVLGAVIGCHAHVMAELLICCVNKTVRSRHTRHTSREVGSQNDTISGIVHRSRQQSDVPSGVHPQRVQHQVCAGRMPSPMHGISQIQDVAPIRELLADGLGGSADEVLWCALPSVMVGLKPVDLGRRDECKNTAADLSSRIII